MINIDPATLPENVQQAFNKFERDKVEYTQLQDRLEQLHQRLEKHRKAAEANHALAEQLDAQWREAFRENDGELTKEIRAMKNSAQESRDFSEEYKTLANTLSPEFELCQIDTGLARKKYLESLKQLKHVYADYNFTKTAEELFSLPEAKPFLESLNYKFKEIGEEMETNEIYVRMPDDSAINQIRLAKEGNLIKVAIDKFFGKSEKANAEESSVLQFPEVRSMDMELAEINIAALARKRTELHTKLGLAQ
jgi:Rad3-related DNA helicase